MGGAKNGNAAAAAGAPPPSPPPQQQQQQQQQQPGPPVPGAPTVTLIRTATATAINAEKEGQQQQQQQQQRGARPFDALASDAEAVAAAANGGQQQQQQQQPPSLSTAAADALSPPPFKPYVRRTRINWAGSAAFLFYLGALAFYLWVRITKTLDLGRYTAYGAAVLAIELLGATTVLLYGVNLLLLPAAPSPDADAVDEATGLPRVSCPYHVRVLVPCYKESLDILRRTVVAARDAPLPPGCAGKTVYLCDDGRDPKKRKWVDALGDPGVVYVSGRQRPAGEMNGKSGNINNVARQLYGHTRGRVPGNELICIFDADQVASKEFFLKMVPLFDGGDDVGMVLSPQCFHNLNPHADIFNHSNVHFWEYMQPGYDALGFISCTGTNFLVRSRALVEVGGSPTWTLTEDFALGMELKRAGWHCRYVQEYLAIGEAPDAVRNCYQQRSRWCKGHFQIFFSLEHCPLLQKGLSPFMRIMYCSGVWSYVVGAVATPFFMMVPVVTIWGGVFPIVVSWWAALGLSVYYVATNAVLYHVRSLRHIEALWFANVCSSIMWWVYVKACWRALLSATGLGGITFKTTLKGASAFVDGAVRDLWLPAVAFGALAASAIAGAVKLFSGPTLASPLAISVLWAFYGAVPSFLAIYYGAVSKGPSLAAVCRLAMVTGLSAGTLAVFLMWGLAPKQFDYAGVAGSATAFFDARRVGRLPPAVGVAAASAAASASAAAKAVATGEISWRGDALLQEVASPVLSVASAVVAAANNLTVTPLSGVADVSGGWLNGGGAGNLKLTSTTAFAVALLSWARMTFPGAAATALEGRRTNDAARWGADWLLKASEVGTGGLLSASASAAAAASASAASAAVAAAATANDTATPPPSPSTTIDLSSGYGGDLLVAQVGNATVDALFWGRPEDIAGPRPAFAVSLSLGAADLAGAASAALAAASVLWKADDPAWSARALARAESLFAAAQLYPGLSQDQLQATTQVAKLITVPGPIINGTVLPPTTQTMYETVKTSLEGASRDVNAVLTTQHDKMLWASAWLYRATANESYLRAANDHFVAYLYQEGGGRALAFTPDNYFWAANVLLATLTDGGTFHERSRHFLRQWACAEGDEVRYTPRGRAVAGSAPTLGASAASAFLAAAYGDKIKYWQPSRADRYACWGLSQSRYFLGDGGRSFVAGFGDRPPGSVQDQAASCPRRPAACDAVSAQLTPGPNPWVLPGALVDGPATLSDLLPDVRPLNSSRVHLVNSASLYAAAAGAAESRVRWEVCLQGFGVLSKDTLLCGKGDKEL